MIEVYLLPHRHGLFRPLCREKEDQNFRTIVTYCVYCGEIQFFCQ